MRLAINFVVGVLHYDSVLHKQYRSVLGDGQSEIHSLALCPTLPIAQTYRSHLIARCSGELITRVRIRFTRDIMPCYSAVCTPITTIYYSGIGIRIGEVAVLSYDVRIIEIQIIHAMLSDIIEEQVIEFAPRAGVSAADGAHSERIDALSDGIAMYGISRLREVIDHSYGRIIIDEILDLILRCRTRPIKGYGISLPVLTQEFRLRRAIRTRLNRGYLNKIHTRTRVVDIRIAIGMPHKREVIIRPVGSHLNLFRIGEPHRVIGQPWIGVVNLLEIASRWKQKPTIII